MQTQAQLIETQFLYSNEDSVWTNDNNWDTGAPVTTNHRARISQSKTVEVDTVVECGGMTLWGGTSPNPAVVNINNGGSLDFNSWDTGTWGGNNFFGHVTNRIMTVNVFSGGSLAIDGAGTGSFRVGDNTGRGTINVDGGSLTLDQVAYIGHADVGSSATISITNSGSLVASADMRLGNGSGALGTLDIGAGSATLSGLLNLGHSSGATGVVTMASGSLGVAGILTMGYSGGAVGRMEINGGTFTASDQALIGRGGTGTLSIDGGAATFNGDIQLASFATSSGRVTVASGTMTMGSAAHFRITDNPASVAEVIVSGGELSATNSNSTVQIRDGQATITQTGGEINAYDLMIGHLKTATGTMNMSGGSNTITRLLTLGNQSEAGVSAASGTLNMSGGWMDVKTLEVGVKVETTGELTLSGADTYLAAETLKLGDTAADVSSTVNVEDGLFQINNLTADGNSANESIALSGGVLKLRQTGGDTAYDDMVALIAADVLTWDVSPIGSLAATYNRADADVTWTNGNGVRLFADTDDAEYNYMWAQRPPSGTIVAIR